MKYSNYGKSDLNFDPIKPNEKVSDLVRSIRDE